MVRRGRGPRPQAPQDVEEEGPGMVQRAPGTLGPLGPVTLNNSTLKGERKNDKRKRNRGGAGPRTPGGAILGSPDDEHRGAQDAREHGAAPQAGNHGRRRPHGDHPGMRRQAHPPQERRGAPLHGVPPRPRHQGGDHRPRRRPPRIHGDHHHQLAGHRRDHRHGHRLLLHQGIQVPLPRHRAREHREARPQGILEREEGGLPDGAGHPRRSGLRRRQGRERQLDDLQERLDEAREPRHRGHLQHGAQDGVEAQPHRRGAQGHGRLLRLHPGPRGHEGELHGGRLRPRGRRQPFAPGGAAAGAGPGMGAAVRRRRILRPAGLRGRRQIGRAHG